MKKFEYKTISVSENNFQEELNKMGEKRWEIIKIMERVEEPGKLLVVFKREVSKQVLHG